VAQSFQTKTTTATFSNVHPGNRVQHLSRNNSSKITSNNFIHHHLGLQHLHRSSNYTSLTHLASTG
jgi:hypothetical protein